MAFSAYGSCYKHRRNFLNAESRRAIKVLFKDFSICRSKVGYNTSYVERVITRDTLQCTGQALRANGLSTMQTGRLGIAYDCRANVVHVVCRQLARLAAALGCSEA